jgi:hypothetical protein
MFSEIRFNTVTQVLQDGFVLNGRCIRPAMVVVNTNRGPQTDSAAVAAAVAAAAAAPAGTASAGTAPQQEPNATAAAADTQRSTRRVEV